MSFIHEELKTEIYPIENLFFTDNFINKNELQNEIHEIIKNDYDVSIGNTPDKAYSNQSDIINIFTALDEIGKEFSKKEKELVKLDLGAVSLASANDSQLRKSYLRNEDRLEDIRVDMLFDKTKMPWHMQRGSALALQTIADAHELNVYNDQNNNGKYNTMCGRLPYFNQEFTFGENDGSLSGLNLKDAIIQKNQLFYNKSEDESIKIADESLVNLDIFFKAPITEEFKDIVTYCQDSLGIRSRKQEVCEAISNHVSEVLKNNPSKENMTLLSIGCGTAQAMLEVAHSIKEKGLKTKLILLDQDPIALAAAKNLAESMGLLDDIEIHCERLFNLKGQFMDMTKILDGRKIDVAEDTGLREYLQERIYCNLTNTVWNHLTDDGLMTTGNMNLNRPQPEFLNGLMGWRPHVIMRNIETGFTLHEKSGIPKGSTKARVTRDGVYTLFFSYK